MTSPNLFDHATKELSQDAVICWLMAWADADATEGPADDGLRRCGRAFVDALFAKWQDWPVELGDRIRAEVRSQENRIDVLARVDGRYVLLIEDKTDTGSHDGQLGRYWTSVVNGDTAFGDVAYNDVFPIYVKTGNHSLADRRHAEAEGYAVFDRSDFLRIVSAYDGTNPILRDFRSYLERWERETNCFTEWTEEGEKSERGWEGFYRCVEERGLADTDARWGALATQVGSYWGIWIEPPETSKTNSFALWVEKNRISFRLYGAKDGTCSIDGMNREKAHWADAFVQSSGGWFTRPSRFVATKTKPMAVAEWCDWLAFSDDGQLDMDQTIENLHWAQGILRDAIKASG